MSDTSRLFPLFYQMYAIENREKSDIIAELSITISMYNTLVREVKKRSITEINTDLIEGILCKKLTADPNNTEILKLVIDVWKVKFKIPNDKPEATNLGEMLRELQKPREAI